MKSLFAPLIVFALYCGMPVYAQDTSLEGSYTVKGMWEKPYTGHADVTEADGIVNLEWFNNAGEKVGIGVGIREGAVLSVIFQSGQSIGLSSYRIEGTTLIGRWTYPVEPKLFTETLTKGAHKAHGGVGLQAAAVP